jgi:hypothetical protein
VSFDNPSGLVDISNPDVVEAIQSAIENDWESGEATINGVKYSWQHSGDDCDDDYRAGWGDVDPCDVTTGGTAEKVGRIDGDKLATLQAEYAMNVGSSPEDESPE